MADPWYTALIKMAAEQKQPVSDGSYVQEEPQPSMSAPKGFIVVKQTTFDAKGNPTGVKYVTKAIEDYPQPEATATGGIGGIGSAGLPDEEAFQRKRTIMGDTVDVANMAMQAWLEALPYMVPGDRETVAGSDALSQALGGVGISYAPRPQHKVKLDLQDFMKQAATALGYDSYMPGATQGVSQGMGQGMSQGGDTSAQDKSIDEYLDMVLQEQKNEELAMTGQVTDPNYMPRTMTNEFTGANDLKKVANMLPASQIRTSDMSDQMMSGQNQQIAKASKPNPSYQISGSPVTGGIGYGESPKTFNVGDVIARLQNLKSIGSAEGSWAEVAKRLKDTSKYGLYR